MRPARLLFHAQVKSAAAFGLVHDPAVRSLLRDELYKACLVTCEATEAGEMVLDPFHK